MNSLPSVESGTQPLGPALLGTANPGRFEAESGKISLEPTIHVDQLSRYLNHINHLRRINEGADNADAPGYALNLVRIPVSVLPGKRTRMGYGAEITVSAEPHLTPDLLPTTFRSLVIEDVVDQLGLPITKSLEDDVAVEKYESILSYYDCVDWNVVGKIVFDWYAAAGDNTTTWDSVLLKLEEVRQEAEYCFRFKIASDPETKLSENVQPIIDDFLERVEARNNWAIRRQVAKWRVLKEEQEKKQKELMGEETYQKFQVWRTVPNRLSKTAMELEVDLNRAEDEIKKYSPNIIMFEREAEQSQNMANEMIQNVAQDFWSEQAGESLNLADDNLFAMGQLTQSGGGIRRRRGRLPFPSSQNRDVFGRSGHVLAHIVIDARRAVKPLLSNQHESGHVHLIDVQAFLRTELESAYDFLSDPEMLPLWKHCSPELVNAVRGRKRWLAKAPESPHETRIRKLREGFFRDIHEHYPRASHSTTASLAWAIVVESALLNQQLIEDMRRISRDKGCDCWADADARFFLPTISANQEALRKPELAGIVSEAMGQHQSDLDEAAAVFNRYVACRCMSSHLIRLRRIRISPMSLAAGVNCSSRSPWPWPKGRCVPVQRVASFAAWKRTSRRSH